MIGITRRELEACRQSCWVPLAVRRGCLLQSPERASRLASLGPRTFLLFSCITQRLDGHYHQRYCESYQSYLMTVTDWGAIDQRRCITSIAKNIGSTNGRLHEFALPKRASHKLTSTFILTLINLGPD
jgi:hypothetical protein